MSLKNYPISFGYNATTTLNGKPYTHKGSDRAAPTGTKIIIGSTTIGETGNTGLSTGPHCHLQAGKDEWAQETINPDPYWFKGGTVHSTGYGDQWGNYICIKVGDVYVYYCHLSEINVKKGQKIGGTMAKITKDQENVLSILATGSRPGSGYNYRHTGLEATQGNIDKMVNFWAKQSLASGGLRKKTADQTKTIAALKKEIGSQGTVLKAGKYIVN